MGLSTTMYCLVILAVFRLSSSAVTQQLEADINEDVRIFQSEESLRRILKQELLNGFNGFRIEYFLEQLEKQVNLLLQSSVELKAKTEQTQADMDKFERDITTKIEALNEKIIGVTSLMREVCYVGWELNALLLPISELGKIDCSLNHAEELRSLQSEVDVVGKTVDLVLQDVKEIKSHVNEHGCSSRTQSTAVQDITACGADTTRLESTIRDVEATIRNVGMNLTATAELWGQTIRSDELTSKQEFCTPLNKMLPEDCSDWLKLGNTTSGIYEIYLPTAYRQRRIQVYCDMETDGGGWTVFQRRGDFPAPRIDFTKNWIDYKWGFGELEKEFWLGLEYIYFITNNRHSILRFDLKDFEGNKRFAVYREFYITSEADKYRIKIDGYYGDAGDSMAYSNNMPFTTKDNDNDMYEQNCAVVYSGAWWHNACHNSNLNGKYLGGKHSSFADGINWEKWLGFHYSLEWTEMKTRPKEK